MAFIRRLNGHMKGADVGAPYRGGQAGEGEVAIHIYVFDEGLVLAPTSLISRHRPHYQLRMLDLKSLDPDAVSQAFPAALRLDRDRVSKVVMTRWKFGLVTRSTATCELLSGKPVLYWVVGVKRGDELAGVLASTYGERFEDRRSNDNDNG
jgi:hypothetical protein